MKMKQKIYKVISRILLIMLLSSVTIVEPVQAAGQNFETSSVEVSYKGTNKAEIKWKKVQGADGYAIYCMNPAPATYEAMCLKTIKNKNTTKAIVKVPGGEYAFFVRAYKKVNGKKIWGLFVIGDKYLKFPYKQKNENQVDIYEEYMIDSIALEYFLNWAYIKK